MPHLVGVDLAEAVSIAMLMQPEIGSRGADVDRFSGHVRGLLRGVHPSPRLGLAAILAASRRDCWYRALRHREVIIRATPSRAASVEACCTTASSSGARLPT